MESISGTTILPKTAIGRIKYLEKCAPKTIQVQAADSTVELARFEQAVRQASEELRGLYMQALQEIGSEEAAIFDIHCMMLEDDDFLDAVQDYITQESVSAEYAITEEGNRFAAMFSEMDDAYMQARSVDVLDITERLRGICAGETRQVVLSEPVILLAEDLTPSETLQLDRRMLLGIVTRFGSENSHTAILARALGIPALVGAEVRQDWEGCQAVLDGVAGQLHVNPAQEVLSAMEQQMQRERRRESLLLELRGKPNVTQDGRTVNVYANIGSPSDLNQVLQADAGGIGLFRSEFLFLQHHRLPTEEEQYAAYRSVVSGMEGKCVIIRTLDIGADKTIDYMELEQEENPALGCRAIRLCLDRPELFRTQLRALFRAAVHGNLCVMYPMISSVWEVRAAKQIAVEVAGELAQEGIPHRIPEQGIMIETPAAALISDDLASEVDFFSIGTNDLTQYTLALDRQNQKLSAHYDPHHPAILLMIKMVVESAHRHGIWAGICGELAADTTLTAEFLRMGVDELSVSPALILELRSNIRNLDLSIVSLLDED